MPTRPSRPGRASTPPSGPWKRCRRCSARSSGPPPRGFGRGCCSASAAGWCAAAIRGAARSRGCGKERRTSIVRASIFCTVREPVPHPLCGFYAAAITRLMALFNVPARIEVVACRGMGEPACVLQVALLDTPASRGGGVTSRDSGVWPDAGRSCPRVCLGPRARLSGGDAGRAGGPRAGARARHAARERHPRRPHLLAGRGGGRPPRRRPERARRRRHHAGGAAPRHSSACRCRPPRR